ncbi:MAG: hypothetical protein LDL19_06865 [Thiobacillus sp.]|nr:hypothetical protein [Thiobacillus sp.]
MKRPHESAAPLLHAGTTAGVGTTGRAERVRPRGKTGVDEKPRKPADDVRKKSPPGRKAPARGRYVDEYARPAL